VSEFSVSIETLSCPEPGRLAGPQSSPVCSGGDRGPSVVFPQPASLDSPHSFLGDSGVRTFGRFHRGIGPRSAPEGGDRTHSQQSRILFPTFHCPQEGWVSQARDQSQTTQPVHHSPSFSDGLGLHCSSYDTGRRLGHLDRSQGLYQSTPGTAISPFHLEVPALHVPVGPIWPFDRPQYIHARHAPGPSLVRHPQYACDLLSGRCASSGTFTSGGVLTFPRVEEDALQARLLPQPEEVGVDPHAVLHLPGPELELSQYDSLAFSGAFRKETSGSSKLFASPPKPSRQFSGGRL